MLPEFRETGTACMLQGHNKKLHVDIGLIQDRPMPSYIALRLFSPKYHHLTHRPPRCRRRCLPPR